MPVIKLSQQLIDSQDLHCPAGKRRVEYCDKDLPGLYLEQRSSGLSSYYFRYKDANNKTCHQKIGRTTDIDLEEARTRAKQLRAEITLGADPRAEANAKKAVPKFTEFFEQQYIPYAKTRKRTWQKDQEYFDLRLKSEFGNKRLNQITRHQVQAFHTRLKEDGLAASTCNHYLKLIHRVLQICLDWELVEKNVASRIPHYSEENMIENYLNDEELKRFVNVLRTDDNRNVCNILLLLLNTGTNACTGSDTLPPRCFWWP